MIAASAIAALPLVLFVGLLGAAALTDLREFRIPNSVTLAIALLFPVHALLPGAGVDIAGSVVLAAAVLAAGTGLFALGFLGGGDVKLIAAVSLWIGPAAFIDFVLITALAGGAFALLLISPWRLVLAHLLEVRGDRTFARVLTGRDIPYAVAVVIGTVVAMPVPPLLGAGGSLAG